MAFGDDVVLMDRLEVLLPRGHEAGAVELAELAHHAGNHLAHAVLDEAGRRCAFSTTSTSSERFISS